MNFLLVAALIVIGLVGAARKIGDMAPGTKDSLKYLTDSENWIGVVSTFIGLYYLIRFLRYIGVYLRHNFFDGIVILAGCLVLIILGLLLARDLYVKWASGNEKVEGFFNKIGTTFDPMREILGLVAIGLGILGMFL